MGHAISDTFGYGLHHIVTSTLLLFFSGIVTYKEFIKPITCTVKNSSIPQDVLNQYCWASGTYSLPDSWMKKVGDEVPYPGFDKTGDQMIYHAYYPWVTFVLFLQAILFRIPFWLWNQMEGGRIHKLCFSLTSNLVHYMLFSIRKHNMYYYKYLLTEILNFANVICQIYLIDSFLGGEFTTYGSKVVQFTGWDFPDRYDPMLKVFPRMTKCNYREFDGSGEVKQHDVVCILPINAINEKIYVFLWFYFIVLAIISGLVLLYELTLFSPRFCFWLVRTRVPGITLVWSRSTVMRFRHGDWFMMRLLSVNLDFQTFKEFASEFAEKLHESDGGPHVKLMKNFEA